MDELQVSQIERVACFELGERRTRLLGAHAASRVSFCTDPDAYLANRPEASWDEEATWLRRRDGAPGLFVAYAEVRDAALSWAVERKLISYEPGFCVHWPEGNGWRELYTLDADTAQKELYSHGAGATSDQIEMPLPSESFATRLKFEFDLLINIPEIVEAAAAGIWLGHHHPQIDGIIAPLGGVLSESNPTGCGSLVMNRVHAWEQVDAPQPEYDPASSASSADVAF